jgi:hypothetical protein
MIWSAGFQQLRILKRSKSPEMENYPLGGCKRTTHFVIADPEGAYQFILTL